jgi:hypothetical protein
MTDLEYYSKLDDFDEIKDFLDIDKPDAMQEITIPPFEPGKKDHNDLAISIYPRCKNFLF